jgi:DNA-binding winged helix-turn-helix (wHTH) protein
MNEHGVLRFDRYELQRRERRLLHDGRDIPLRARSFDLLVVLAERAGRLVTKNELLDLVRPGLVVEESNVPAQVATLRKALPTDLVATVPGQGYRLQAVLHEDIASPVAVPPSYCAQVRSAGIPGSLRPGR